MNRLLVAFALLPSLAFAATELTPAEVQRYREASAKISLRAYGEAIAILNELAAAHPRVAEIFASRCSAQVGAGTYATAEADCAYALQVSPGYVPALYMLGMAQEAQGKRDAAMDSYRRYCANDAQAAPYRDQALARMSALAAPPPPPPVDVEVRRAPPVRITVDDDDDPPAARSTCLMGSNGRNACGYNCRIGSDGVSACADSPDGTCAIDAYGHVSCSRVGRGGGRRVAGGPKPECRMGSHGENTCGYNCRMGSNGHFYCASTPDGQCAFNADGTFSCP